MASKFKGAEWEWIGVTPDQLKGIPHISQALKKVIGGKAEIVELLRKSESKEAEKILGWVDNAPSWEFVEALPLEAFCVAAKVPVKKLFSVIVDVVFEESHNEAILRAAIGVPDVVDATIESAKAGGSAAQKMILQHAKIVPVPKTNIMFNAPGGIVDQSSKVQNVVMPIAEDGVKKMSERFNKTLSDSARGLLPPAETVEVVEADYEEEGDPEE